MHNASFWGYFFHASFVVKIVMLILLTASVASWTFIFDRYKYLKQARQEAQAFNSSFWQSDDLVHLYQTQQGRKLSGLAAIFHAGFKEFAHLNHPGVPADHVMAGAQRAMRAAQIAEQEKCEAYLPWLATIGSVGPYVGLFGTVWGIMAAFSSLSQVSQATIAMVAPGISEALVATALGLFAAIPAVIAYNRFTHQVDGILNHFERFEDAFSSLLYRHAQQYQAQTQEMTNATR